MKRNILFLFASFFVMVVIAGLIGLFIYDADKKDETNAPSQVYKWRSGEWSECDKECGGGTKTRGVTCYDETNKKLTDLAKCKDVKDKPTESMRCNVQACQVNEWHIQSTGPCLPAGCGPGTRLRVIKCQNKTSKEIVDDLNCEEIGSKPALSEPCNNQTCAASWQPGDFGLCSRLCGGGTRTRDFRCIGTDRDTNVNSGNCPSPQPPPGIQPCNTQECPGQEDPPQWSWNSWETCSKTCGGGTQTRTAQCKRGITTLLDTQCSGTKPEDQSQDCNTQACLTGQPPINWEEIEQSERQMHQLVFPGASSNQYPVGSCGGYGNSRWSIVSPFVFEKWENNKIQITGENGNYQVLTLKYRGCDFAGGRNERKCPSGTTTLCKTYCEDLINGQGGFNLHFTVNHDSLKFGGAIQQQMICGQAHNAPNSEITRQKFYVDVDNNDWKSLGLPEFTGCDKTIYSMRVHLGADWQNLMKSIKDNPNKRLRIALPLQMLNSNTSSWQTACKMKEPFHKSPVGNRQNFPCMITPYHTKSHQYCPMVPLGS